MSFPLAPRASWCCPGRTGSTAGGTLPAARWLPVDQRGIPAGSVRDVAGTPLDFRAPREIGQVTLDHAFTGLARDGAGRAWARLTSGTAGAALWAGPGYGWL